MHHQSALAILFGVAAAAQDTSAFSVLEKHCFSCHSQSVKMSGLDLSSREAALRGGSKGPAFVAGHPQSSLLIQAVEQRGALKMPPGKVLTAGEIASLRSWLATGANWPKTTGREAPAWWSFQKPKRTATGKSIDEFIYASLRAKGLTPAPEASRAVLIRRLSFDLTGLPPTFAEVRAYVNDRAPDAWEKLVDRMLTSPHYGEKWGRFWLDLVRYADTAGFELDSFIPDAWRYRDYIVDSFNKDKPYDRFIQEQIAGDEFWPEDPLSVTGTGYYCVGPNRDLYPDQADINRVETLTDFVDTTAAVFQGLTLGCARCHDHKYDPLPQRDYYRFQALFAPLVKTKVALNRLTSLGFDVAENFREIKLRDIGEEIGQIQAPCRTKLYEQKLAALSPEVQEALRANDTNRTPRQKELATEFGSRVNVRDEEVRTCLSQAEAERLHAMEKRLVGLFASYRAKPFSCGVMDPGNFSPKTYLPVKGERLGTPVEPGFLSVLGGGEVPPAPDFRDATGPIPLLPTTGRRRMLANWLTSIDNPLTARVMVNRIWQGHFGRGLVATPSDFGHRGAAPSHPELLDWLAVEFAERKWSIKAMHRLILTSQVYKREAGAADPSKDPQNIYLSRFPRRRLQSEEMRDGALAVSGALNAKLGGRPVIPPLSQEELRGMTQRIDDAWPVTFDKSEYTRRSIYMLQKRTFRMPVMEVFDAPENMLTCPRRDASTTATQSLTWLNGAFLLDQARHLAGKIENGDTVSEAWRRVLLRDPTASERARAEEFLRAQTANTGNRGAAIMELVRGLLNLNEFLYVD